ncbi:MAG TPA: hypothetical protein VF766_15465 [Pyrinomonadaceae bacterium]
MSKIRLVLALAFLSMVLPMSIAAQKRGAAARDYFPLRVGDSWTYRHTDSDTEYTVKVLSEEKQADGTIRYLLEKKVGVDIHSWFSKSAGAVLMHREAYPEQEGLDVKHEPARQYLLNPLVAGAKWKWSGKSITGIDAFESSEVIGPEVVKVPAGTFRAMKVMSRATEGEAVVKKTYWYAEGVGLVKSLTESPQLENTWELVSYSFKKASPRQTRTAKTGRR